MQAAFLSLTRSSHAGCPSPWPLQVSFYFWTLVLLLPPQEHSFLSEKIRASANSWHTQATFANGKLLETCRERTFLKRRFIKKKKKKLPPNQKRGSPVLVALEDLSTGLLATSILQMKLNLIEVKLLPPVPPPHRPPFPLPGSRGNGIEFWALKKNTEQKRYQKL